MQAFSEISLFAWERGRAFAIRERGSGTMEMTMSVENYGGTWPDKPSFASLGDGGMRPSSHSSVAFFD
jgi:hypothetical protein